MVRPALASAAACVAVLALPCALIAQVDTLQDEVNRALDRARPTLLSHLRRAGQPLARGLDSRPGALALTCFAALHDGIPPDDPVLAVSLQRLFRSLTDATYDLALRLMVLEALPKWPDREKLARADADLLLRCRQKGLFGYTPERTQPDLSNTQYGALGLRAAGQMGVKIDPRVWQELLHAVGEMQDFEGGFGYQSSHDAATASMTVAGVAVLEVCREALEHPGHPAPKIAPQVKKAWQWMDRHDSTIGSPQTPWCYYFHYGLERAAILSDVTKVGEKDWYRTGARMMLKDQLPSGGWAGEMLHGFHQDDGDPVTTAFAVLFLSRAFHKLPAPVTPGSAPTLLDLGAQSPAALVRAVADALVTRGRPALGEVLKAMRSEVVSRRQAAALTLKPLCGDDFGYQPELDAEQNGGALRRAELWYLKNKDAK
jgi:hypothetical protein